MPAKYTFSKVFGGNSCGANAHATGDAAAHGGDHTCAADPSGAGTSAAADAAAADATAQSEFFRETTLPLVKDLLDGKNSLVFTYGVTNSGKTYTVQGNSHKGGAGILPRAIDVIFNSTRGLECRRAIRPVGLTGVQPGVSDPHSSLLRETPGAKHAPHAGPLRAAFPDTDETRVPVDGHYRYSVWVSYVEVYNEKLYDLLDTSAAPASSDALEHADAAQARRPLALKSEVESGGKYVGGLKEIKVSSIEEAKELLRRGKNSRTVYGTMANHVSSRSHSVFTIKVIREHTGVQLEDRDVAGLARKYFISRLSIVDLAGSERVANTDVCYGPRLKEAGNINMSLMCLGQCLETMRKNQRRAGLWVHSGATEERRAAQPGHAKPGRRQSIIPFRHSKLTGLFQSFFTGDGKVVMIVNVNPCLTGFEENANVLRFSAMAKDVGIHVNQAAKQYTLAVDDAASDTSQGTALDAGSVIGSDDDDDEENDDFVRMLIEENERLRARVRWAHVRSLMTV